MADRYPWIKDIPPKLKPLLNKLIGNLTNFYFSLVKKGFYLPERKTKAINGEYLWKVFTNQVYCPKTVDIKIGHCKEKVSKI